MKGVPVRLRFRHAKKAGVGTMSVSTVFFPGGDSTGPIFPRGEFAETLVVLEPGDILEFATTKFMDEFDLKHWRGKEQLNMVKVLKKRGKK